MKLRWADIRKFWFYFSVAAMVGSMPFSKLGLSISQMMLLGGWIESRIDYRDFMARLRTLAPGLRVALFLPRFLFTAVKALFQGLRESARNAPAMAFASIFLLHIIGLFWTTDFDYAVKDLRTKIPILMLSVVLASYHTLGRKAFYRVMLFFVAAVLVRSFYNAWMIAGHRFVDVREISHNVSHIIYALLVAMAIYTVAWLALKRGFLAGWQRALLALAGLWLAAYLVISQSFTGISVTILTLMVLVPVMIAQARRKSLRLALFAGLLLLTAGIAAGLVTVVRDYYAKEPRDCSKLDKVSSRGNPYLNACYDRETENGHYLWQYIQWDELRESWSKRSRIPFDSLNRKHEPVAYTVIRFLTSKGWRKDADALEKLSPREISAIEDGTANVLFMERFSIRGRIYEFLHGYDLYRQTGNPSGSTVMQRFEFWKASAGIIRDNWPAGVGTGDMNLAFAAQYERMHTKLEPDQRWRSHNQYLSILVGFGVIGLVWFLWALIWPAVRLKRWNDYFFLVFFTILALSMLTGDTIESQTGVSFFAIFYTLFLFVRTEKDPLFTPSN